MKLEELPEILTAQHIASYLQISRKTIYSLMESKPDAGGIPTMRIGGSKRVLLDDFVQWMNERKEK